MATEDPEWGAFLEGAFLSVLEMADEGIIVFDRDGRCRMIGRRAGELFGIEPASHVGKPRADVLRAMAEACEEPESFLAHVGANDLLEPPKIAAEIDVRRPRPRTVLWTTIPIIREGAAWGRLGLVRDVTRERSAERAQKQLHARLSELTPVDALTGLLNMRRFREELEREHGRSTRAWDSYGVLRLDVDNMREMNDELGVPVGDSVLEQVAETLTACRREYDVVARYDGDEFVVLLPGADAVAAKAVAERMANAVYAHDFTIADGRRVTISVGGCVWVPPSGESGEDISRRAGAATKEARSSGAGLVRIDAGTVSGANASAPPPPPAPPPAPPPSEPTT
jgi:diguanylate cyclase (GGDEF)-like protein